MSDADDKVIRLVTQYAREGAESEHLRSCPGLTVAYASAEDGEYGCDTGCEYARLEADLSCPHGESERYRYGTFSDIASMMEDLDALT